MRPVYFKPENIFISAQIIVQFSDSSSFFCDFYAFAMKGFLASVVLFVILNASYLQPSYFEEKDWVL